MIRYDIITHRNHIHISRRFSVLGDSYQCCCQDLFRSRDQDRDLDKMNSSALESRDHGLEITTLICTQTTWLLLISSVTAY